MEIEPTTTASSTTGPKSKKAAQGPLAKHWAGCTLNNYTAVDEARLQDFAKQHCDYMVYGREVGESGTPHLQFMLCLKKQCRGSTLAKAIPRAIFFVKSKHSTMQQASDYCKKDGNFVEFGTLPKDQHEAGLQKIRDNYEDTLAKAKAGRIDDIIPKHQIIHYKTIKQIAHDNKPMPKDLTWGETGITPNEWIWGPTRTGKSFTARAENPGAYMKMNNKWWDRYNGQKVVIIEDLGQSHEYLGDHLKIWADVYAFPAEIKNSGDLIRPEKIVVTSNYSIQELFPDPNIHEPLLKRFRVRHLTQAWDDKPQKLKLSDDSKSKKRKPAEKKRKFDTPLVRRPPMFRQDASGALVPWTGKQLHLSDKLTREQRIAMKEPRPLPGSVTEISSDSDDYSTSMSEDSPSSSSKSNSVDGCPDDVCCQCHADNWEIDPDCECDCHSKSDGGLGEKSDDLLEIQM